MLIDLHVHSHHTRGGALRPAEVLAAARAAGLDGVVFTDVNTLEGLAEAHAAGREAGLLALVGAEVVTDHGHFLCYFPEPEKVPALPQLFGGATPWSAREVLQKVQALGGAVVAAHPYDRGLAPSAGDAVFTLDGLAAVEGLHGRRRGGHDDLAIEAADHLNLPCVGGSGALEAVKEIGGAATLFKEPIADEAGLVAALRAGAVFCVALGVKPPPPERGGRGGRDERGGRGGGREERGGRGGGRDDRGGRGRGPRR